MYYGASVRRPQKSISCSLGRFFAKRSPIERDEEHDYFENVYWCAYLLFHVGEPADVELMWTAKNLNMDVGCGFDVENMVGAGVEKTIEYLRQEGLDAAADYLAECFSGDSQQAIEEWSRDRRGYFYGA